MAKELFRIWEDFMGIGRPFVRIYINQALFSDSGYTQRLGLCLIVIEL